MSNYNPIDIEKSIKEVVDFQENMLRGAKSFLDVQKDEAVSDQLEKETVFTISKMKLVHYKPLVKSSEICKVPLLISYALVNRYYMLDLQPDRSVIKGFLEAGLDVYLIDWGYPTAEDRYMTMDDHINWYMDECVDFIRNSVGVKKVNLLGICQGANFATCYTALHNEKVNSFVCMVAPIDFTTNKGLLFKWGKSIDADALVDAYGVIPSDVMNASFLILKPFSSTIGKYVNLAYNPKIGDKGFLTNFLRMEKWVFDSPAQEGETIRQFLKDEYRDNKLVKGELVLGDKTVNLKNITCPVLNVCGEQDHLVPNDASKPLNDYIGSKDKEFICYPVGHIGMYTGSKSQQLIVPKITSWIISKSK